MNAALVKLILTYIITYGLPAIDVIKQLIAAGEQLLAKGKPTDAEIDAAAAGIITFELPKPDLS